DFDNRMDFPRGLSPRVMILVRANFLNGGAYVGGAIMFVIPKPVTRYPDLTGGMAGRFIVEFEGSKESSQFLDPNFVFKNPVLGSRTNFANDRRRIAGLRWTRWWFLKQFEMPVVKVDTGTIGCFGRPAIGHAK